MSLSTSDRIAYVDAFLRNRRNLTHAAKALGKVDNTLSRNLERWGYYAPDPSRHTWRTQDIATLRRMFAEGATYPQIAEVLGIKGSQVKSYIGDNRKKFNLPKRRPRWGHGQIKAVHREAELAISRAISATGRTIVAKLTGYLLQEGTRKRRAEIVDLGGMVALAPPGPQRRPKSLMQNRRKKAA